MKIYYRDDYGTDIHSRDSDAVPRVGESVSFVNEDWRVKSVTWMIQEDAVIVELSQTVVRVAEENSLQETVADLKKTVTGIMQSQQAGEKKTRQLREQVATLRQGINQRIYNESKK
jgi:hypothetical protein